MRPMKRPSHSSVTGSSSSGARPPRRGPKPPSGIIEARPPVTGVAPPAVIEAETSPETTDDSPICLSGCASGGPGSGEDLGTGPAGPGGEGEGPGPAVCVGGDIREPRRIHGSAPAYPDLARRAHIQGKVVLECVIDTEGRVTDLRVVSGSPILAEAATEAGVTPAG